MAENVRLNDRDWRKYLQVREGQRKRDEFAEKHPFLYAAGCILGGVVFAVGMYLFIILMACM